MLNSLKTFLSAWVAVLFVGLGHAAIAQSPTVEAIKDRNFLRCGVSINLRGFSEPLDDGSWVGFDVDFCRAVSVALFGEPDRVEYVPLTGSQRFPALQSGDVDMLSRVTTWTFSRDVDLKLSFAGVDYYDDKGFWSADRLVFAKHWI